MENVRWLLILLLTMMSSGPVVADTVTLYDITFMPDLRVTSSTPSGSFSYDTTTPAFSDFIVDFDGVTLDLTASANNPSNVGGYPACIGTDTGAKAGFDLLDGSCAGSYFSGQVNETPNVASFVFGAPLSGCEAFGPCIYVTDNEFGASFSSLTPTATTGTFSIAPEAASAPEPSSFGLTLGAVILVCIRLHRNKKLRTR